MVSERLPTTVCVTKDVLELGVYDALTHLLYIGLKPVIKVFKNLEIVFPDVSKQIIKHS